jgi:mitogen-activated protein kinase kinase 3
LDTIVVFVVYTFGGSHKAIRLTYDFVFFFVINQASDGAVNLLSQSLGVYNINELGLQKRSAGITDDINTDEKTYRCASHEMHVFGAIGNGASSIVQKAIFIPAHHVLALKKINVFEKVSLSLSLSHTHTHTHTHTRVCVCVCLWASNGGIIKMKVFS